MPPFMPMPTARRQAALVRQGFDELVALRCARDFTSK